MLFPDDELLFIDPFNEDEDENEEEAKFDAEDDKPNAFAVNTEDAPDCCDLYFDLRNSCLARVATSREDSDVVVFGTAVGELSDM